MKNKAFVSYEEFGAVGDGVTNDFAAIYAAHLYANEHKLPIKTDGDRCYYISDTRIDGEVKQIPIRTSTYFGETNFIIDDTNYNSIDGTGISNKNVFIVQSEYPEITITDGEVLSRLAGIGEGTKKLDLKLGYPALLIIYDENDHAYGRSGASHKGKPQAAPAKNEIILIDGEGNVDESTPFNFDYAAVTKVEIIRCDVEHIVIDGGIFTTRASRGPGRYTDAQGNSKKTAYVHRGILINRSSASAIAICGMLEMNKMLPDSALQKNIFKNAAAKMLDSLIDNCTYDKDVEFEGLINKVTHAKPQGRGINECAAYGDYFYLEALARNLLPDFKKYW